MKYIPFYIDLTFYLSLCIAVWIFLKATDFAKPIWITMAFWIAVQSVLGIMGFYYEAIATSMRFNLVYLPPLILLLSLFSRKNGRDFVDSLSIRTLTIFHTIRLPIEIVLFWLSIYDSIPAAMTFRGTNFDILSGLSAPLIYYLAFIRKTIGKGILVAWNIACVILLINCVANSILSLPDLYQLYGFDKPNIAFLYFPFILIPALIVPLTLFANLTAIKRLLNGEIL